MVKAVIDTSVFVAAYLSKNRTSAPNRILDAWQNGKFTLVMSPQMDEELVSRLLRKGVSADLVTELVEVIEHIAQHIPGAYEATRLDTIDPDDNKVLATAFEAGADYIVSTDKQHLLPLKHFHGTQIVDPAGFLGALAK
jgi:putative PIN family toxin of toxin-antitoxin system